MFQCDTSNVRITSQAMNNDKSRRFCDFRIERFYGNTSF